MVTREKLAWVWLVTMAVTYLPYFVAVTVLDEAGFAFRIGLFAAATLTQLAILGIALMVIAAKREPGPSLDERDRSIQDRSGHVAYGVLVCGMIVVGCLMPFNHAGWDLFNAAVLAIVVAEGTRHGLTVSLYRRGWHG